MAMYACQNQEHAAEIEEQIEASDSLIGSMLCEANEQEIQPSVMISRLLCHGIVNLHHLLISQNEDITEDAISNEIIRSASLIHSMYAASKELEGPRILH